MALEQGRLHGKQAGSSFFQLGLQWTPGKLLAVRVDIQVQALAGCHPLCYSATRLCETWSVSSLDPRQPR